MENQHRLISGYRDLTQAEIDGMNSIKDVERLTAALFRKVEGELAGDPRALELAKANLQQGFMWLVRSIARPADPFEN